MSYGPLQSLCQESVTIEPFVTTDKFSVPSYGDAATYPARVEIGSRLIAGSAGQQITARGRVYVLTTCTFDTRDRLTLPAYCDPTQPPILTVQPERDAGTRFCVVYYG